ncbi:MAG TPA: hypothetical protein VL691_15040 [Vicinamibacteria bacterium]|nr:hypothetical protein [Vicinamibacteria bacterium]
MTRTGLALALLQVAAASGRAADLTPDGRPAAPVTAEHRYRLSAAIRPLLFWIGAGNVGGARIVWRGDAEGRRGYELLLGSDPGRAPRRINRWGWAREDADASGATMLGVMNRSEDDNLDHAKATLGRGKEGYFFKLIRARIEGGGARAESTSVFAPQDYDFRQLGELRRFVEGAKPVPRVRWGALPPATNPGLLFALAELVRAGVAAARAPGTAGPRPSAVQYTFDAGLYDLVISSWQRVDRARYGTRTYERLVRLEFESRNREKGTTEHFVFACGTDGELAEVPVFVRYQPKWWFKVEGVLDETETL